MKKLYRRGTVHPSPPIISDHLAFLPATILTLAAALSLEDREVLAYLLSCSNSSVNLDGRRRATHQKGCADHPPQFNCNCFRCYTSYWVRWDSSPNREEIHEIIDAFEAELMAQSKKSGKSRKERRKRGCNNGSAELKRLEGTSGKDESSESDSLGGESSNSGHESLGGAVGGEGEEGYDKGSVRRFVSFIGEKIWGVWNP
ncbi:hypothetical protein CJ030_MR2G011851 [Morella rubra]|uniref:Uncharacterized protein n=1 Tax=Morella rubra TaxID=262757 RepID=A0A6A1VJG9_9ROSI|nr:hypothetical protein CJ030_MR5G011855 [Morella rubra]KAB1221749.1 hypothetical protein CJ030_MR2G011851 [Morella rubra]